MANAKNTAAVAELKNRFEEANSVVLTEYRGLSVAQTTELRRALGADVQYSVAKNTMIKLAAKEAGVEGLDDLLTGPTAVAFIKGEAVDAAKALKKFGKDNKAFVVKGGYMDGNALSLITARPLSQSLLAPCRATWQRPLACSTLPLLRLHASALLCRRRRTPKGFCCAPRWRVARVFTLL